MKKNKCMNSRHKPKLVTIRYILKLLLEFQWIFNNYNWFILFIHIWYSIHLFSNFWIVFIESQVLFHIEYLWIDLKLPIRFNNLQFQEGRVFEHFTPPWNKKKSKGDPVLRVIQIQVEIIYLFSWGSHPS